MPPQQGVEFISPPHLDGTGGGLVVWRTWVVRPDDWGEPMLSGLFGFPWRDRVMDAKCVLRDRSRSDLPMAAEYADRYHRAVPDPGCSCGIYADRDPFGPPPRYLRLRGQPLASGFVALSGRVVVAATGYRAERAQIVGPLTLSLASPSWLDRITGAPGRFGARAVIALDDRYVVTARRGGRAMAADEWRDRTARYLALRYGVPVVSLPHSTG